MKNHFSAYLILLILILLNNNAYSKHYHILLKIEHGHPKKERQYELLKKDIVVLKKRLEIIGAKQIKLKSINYEGIIDIQLSINDADTTALKSLIKMKGKFEVYDSYKVSELADFLIRADDSLYKYNKKANQATSRQPLYDALGMKDYIDSINISKPIIGVAKRKDIEVIDSMINKLLYWGIFPERLIFAWSAKPIAGTDLYPFYALKNSGPLPHQGIISSSIVREAKANYSKMTGGYVIDIQLDKKGTEDLFWITKTGIGQILAMTIDDKVYSAPVIRATIEKGMFEISSDFSQEEAELMADIIQSGELAAPLKIIKFEETR